MIPQPGFGCGSPNKRVDDDFYGIIQARSNPTFALWRCRLVLDLFGGLPGMIRQQFIRYAIIGVLLNASLYGAYLLLTHTLMGSRAAMSITYCAGVLIGFLLNRKITFSFRGGDRGALFRYIVSYAVGYGINLLGLWLFVDVFGFAHELVQGCMIIFLAFMLFALQKWWVFAQRQAQPDPVSSLP